MGDGQDDTVAVLDLRTLGVTGRLEFPKGSIPDGMAWAEPREWTRDPSA